MRLKAGIEQLMRRQDLEARTCHPIFSELLDAKTDPTQAAAFLVLLRSKSETAEELAGLVACFQEKMISIKLKHKVLDIVGTGGDGAGTVNISTGSAILAASCGVKIVKHGNTAVTSLTGSADVLAALGLNINLSPEKIAAGVDELGIGFCFSPHFHPTMRDLRALRQKLAVPTTLNLLGPLLNPAKPAHYVLGVYDASLLDMMATSLQRLGTARSWVVHGNGTDEISCMGPVTILDVSATAIKTSVFDPLDFGLDRCHLADLQGGNATTNAQLLRDVFQGKQSKKLQAIADTLTLNAAVALYLYGIEPSVDRGLRRAKEHLHCGSALTLLNNWIEFSHD